MFRGLSTALRYVICIVTQTGLFQGLMRELEVREKKINDIQALGDKLVREGHPGKKTVEVRALVEGCIRWHNGRFFDTCNLLFSPPHRVDLHGCSADSVELDPATLLLHRGSPQRKHSLLSGTAGDRVTYQRHHHNPSRCHLFFLISFLRSSLPT